MDFRLIISSCIILAIDTLAKMEKIMGGENINIKNVPYMVSLKLGEAEHFCGGAIISNLHILTAAHCISDKMDYLDSLTIHVGTSSSSASQKNIFKVRHFHIPEGFTGLPQSSEDIAVLTLENAIIFNKMKQRIKLPTKDIEAGQVGLITGWGTTTYPSFENSQRLKKAWMQVVDPYQCDVFLEDLDYKGRFCAVHKKGIGNCYGDSGSPFVIGDKIVGISAFVVPCATGEPDVYTNVYTYLHFINRVIGTI